MLKQLHEDDKIEQIIENAVSHITSHLKSKYMLSKRSIALLLLQGDSEVIELVKTKESVENFTEISSSINDVKSFSKFPISYELSINYKKKASKILDGIVSYCDKKNNSFSGITDSFTMNPISGAIILLIVIYFAFYKFVGGFGAGTLVNFIENGIFSKYVNPYVNEMIQYIPWQVIRDLLGNDYGIITMGVKYAVAIVLPIITIFFFVFSIIEDSGYLPRIAFLLDFIFKKIGLNGRAVIPMTLGFGCDTMATMVSRTLETKRERIIATFLLALAIPCSAQLGVILGLLSGRPLVLGIWVIFMIFVFLIIGYLTSKVLPGDKPLFYMEIPPLRIPSLRNIFSKTFSRVSSYFSEIFPLFILASVLIWIGNITGFIVLLLNALNPVVNALGLPNEMSKIFLFGFFRRDYGAAGLYDLQQAGVLNSIQLIVSAATLTLFVPCIAQFMMMIKERGLKTAIYMGIFIFPFAFACGFFLNKLLVFWGFKI